MKRSFLFMAAVAMLMAGMMSACAEKDPHPGYQNQNGMYYQFFTKNEGATPQVGDVMEVRVACLINDSVPLFPAAENMMGPIQTPNYPGDINEGFLMMHKGDSVSFIVNIDSTFKYMYGMQTLPPEFKSTDVMRWEIKLMDFYPEKVYAQNFANGIKIRNDQRALILQETYPEESAKAAKDFANFLAKNKIDVEPTASGLYYVVTEPGNGEKPDVGKPVTMHYTGKLLNGEVFESSYELGQPLHFMLGIGQVIPGWDEGIQLMSKGEKGVLYIPYYLAYGERDMGKIPPFSNLIFEVELVDFETFK